MYVEGGEVVGDVGVGALDVLVARGRRERRPPLGHLPRVQG